MNQSVLILILVVTTVALLGMIVWPFIEAWLKDLEDGDN